MFYVDLKMKTILWRENENYSDMEKLKTRVSSENYKFRHYVKQTRFY